MATTKIKPLKSTVGKAIKYICNPEKTEGGILIDSFCCSPETAAIDFALTSQQGHRSRDKGTLAYHMIQSFKPGEVSAETAHEIGKEYADAVLKGNYEYVMSTHIDRNHIHNHIIFNAVSYTTHKKYDSCTRSRYSRERLNDKICREHNLSVIKEKSGVRGRERYEYGQEKKGTSWKAKLKKAIDAYVVKAESFEEFLQMMQLAGYEIRQQAELSFRSADGQKYFTKIKNIGKAYTEENIKKRISDKENHRTDDTRSGSEKKKTNFRSGAKKEKAGQISILVDIKNNLKAQQSAAYKNKLVLENINRMIETVNFLDKNNLGTDQELSEKINVLNEKCEICKDELKDIEREMRQLSEQIKYSKDFWKYKKVYEQSKKENIDSPFWTDDNTKKIILFENAERYRKKNGLSYKDLAVKPLIGRYNLLREKHGDVYKEYSEARDSLKELTTVKDNIENILGRKIDKKENIEQALKQNMTEKDSDIKR